jgi:hypothetical protein
MLRALKECEQCAWIRAIHLAGVIQSNGGTGYNIKR